MSNTPHTSAQRNALNVELFPIYRNVERQLKEMREQRNGTQPPSEEEKELEQQRLELRHRIAENNLPVIWSFIGRYVRQHNQAADCEDFEQAFCLSLMKAIDHFDIDSGNQFSTYLHSYLRGAYLDQLKVKTHTKRARGTNGELHTVPLTNTDPQVLDTYHGRQESHDDRLDAAAAIRQSMQHLSVRETAIIHHRFIEGLTLKMTAEIIGVTKERIRQIEVRALSRMRECLPDDMCA